MTTTSDTPSQVDGREPVDGGSLRPIPQPRRPMSLLGNVADLRADGGALGFMRLAREYGPIYRLALPGGPARPPRRGRLAQGRQPPTRDRDLGRVPAAGKTDD
jgi:hypothetical protein